MRPYVWLQLGWLDFYLHSFVLLYHNVYSMRKLLQFFGSARGINKDASRIIYLKRIVIITLYI